MAYQDDDLRLFAAAGAAPLPAAGVEGTVERDGAGIAYATFGTGPPVVLLHGGLGHGGNWGFQVPALVAGGYRAVVIDSRGHGRSTRDAAPYRYERMAADVLGVMDAVGVASAALVGWSDGATVALLTAMAAPARVAGVFFFACTMDPSGVKPFAATPVIDRCFARHGADYARLSATPADFEPFVAAVSRMQATEPNCTAAELAAVRVPVAIAHAQHDEFIERSHAQYLAGTIPGAAWVELPGVSHFAPLQRPDVFNAAVLAFLGRVIPVGR